MSTKGRATEGGSTSLFCLAFDQFSGWFSSDFRVSSELINDPRPLQV
jgi:hypothetical protein